MDLFWYLDVLTYELQNAEERAAEEIGGENVVELRRGTIDQILR